MTFNYDKSALGDVKEVDEKEEIRASEPNTET